MTVPSRISRRATLAVIWLGVAAATGWGCLALNYAGPQGEPWHSMAVGGFLLCGVAALIAAFGRRLRWKALAGFFAGWLLLLCWWMTIEPSNDRVWEAGVARLASVEVDGNVVRVHNVRNFDYLTEVDFEPRYQDRTYRLDALQSVDLFASYWMGPTIAHTVVSFGFTDGDYLAISIETRKEEGEGHSSVRGIFKQYELFYVVADERDVIRLRTSFRADPAEEVYLFRLKGSPDDARRLLLEYLRRINALSAAPEFYNTLTDNCTTGIWSNSLINVGHLDFSWKILASGYVPEYLHAMGRIANEIPFEEVKRLGYINERARAAGGSEDFSRLIRQGVPGIDVHEQRVFASFHGGEP